MPWFFIGMFGFIIFICVVAARILKFDMAEDSIFTFPYRCDLCDTSEVDDCQECCLEDLEDDYRL